MASNTSSLEVLAGGHLLLMTNCGPLDVLGHLTGGKRYEDLAGSAPTMTVGDLAVRVLGVEALLEEKRTLGRPKDRAVAEMLAELLERESPDEP